MPSLADLILEKFTPVYGVATAQGPDAGSVQELLNRWWIDIEQPGLPTYQGMYTYLKSLEIAGSTVTDMLINYLEDFEEV